MRIHVSVAIGLLDVAAGERRLDLAVFRDVQGQAEDQGGHALAELAKAGEDFVHGFLLVAQALHAQLVAALLYLLAPGALVELLLHALLEVPARQGPQSAQAAAPQEQGYQVLSFHGHALRRQGCKGAHAGVPAGARRRWICSYSVS